jgi:hypothetical protein
VLRRRRSRCATVVGERWLWLGCDEVADVGGG